MTASGVNAGFSESSMISTVPLYLNASAKQVYYKISVTISLVSVTGCLME